MIGNSSSVCNRLTVLPLRSRRWSKEKGSHRGLRTLGINIRATVSTTILAVILRFIGVVTIVITTGTVIIAGGSSSDSSNLRLTINTSTAAGNSRCRGQHRSCLQTVIRVVLVHTRNFAILPYYL